MNLIKQRLVTFFQAYPKDALYFMAASFMNATGKAILWPLTTLYVHEVLGRSYGEAGMVLLYQALAGIAGEFAGGALYHRLGAKTLIVSSMALSACLLGSIVFVDDYWLFVALVCVNGFMNGIAVPSINAYVGFRWKEYRRKLYNAIYVGNNTGLAIGAALGGLIASFSFPLTYAVTSVSTFAFAVFLFFFMKPASHDDDYPAAASSALDGNGDGSVLRNLLNVRVYLFLGLGALFYYISFTLWSNGIAPYLTEQGYPLTMYSLLWTINGIVIFAGQPVTNFIKSTIAKSLVAQIVMSSSCYALGLGFILLFHQGYLFLVIGMIVCTIGEMLLLPAIPTFYSERTGKAAPFFMGLSGGFGNTGRMTGPTLYGNVYDHWGVVPVLVIGTCASVISVGFFLIHASLHKEKASLTQRQAVTY
ncbi:MFS transporter [Paenibacillus piri]|uniref:MFS transporter n=1 Tax=Paenibacillus piri TaxID=2547395 RepID=A0A4R5KH88_9BACL|nr:MFS transporter [Paenibacillus piri]TDF93717.1 MFS transporter [Paenibacillus piri]